MIVKPVKINLKVSFPKKIKWGVAFNKNFEVQSFFSAIQLINKSRVTSIYSNGFNEAKEIAEKNGVSEFTNDLNAFLNNEVDIVYLADNSNEFYKNAKEILEKKKFLLCEKPTSISSNEIEDLIEIAQQKNAKVIINYSHRFNPLVVKAKELIDKQVIGKIHSISASYHIDFLPDESSIYKSKLSGISVLRDLGNQMIDLLQYLGGDIKEIKSFGDKLLYKNPQNDFLISALKFENNFYGNISVSYLSKKPINRIEILGHNGSILIENIFDKKKSPTILTINLFGEAKKVFRKRINKTFIMLKNSQKDFLKNENISPSLFDALKNFKIIEEIEKQIT
ncbi:MAG: Gfo/Idh/MocA family oxidoreductase [Melioribacteraceae bacterium]|nr:Gfo/Idh/MocA family oxidoreductase [Melioribacteraceae bacterium]